MSHIIPTETHLRIWNPKGDPLGRQELAKSVIKNILTKMKTPNVLGIYGDWGSGKTTFLHYLQMVIDGEQKAGKGRGEPIEDEELLMFRENLRCEDPDEGDLDKIEIVYFEPWKYEYAKESDLLFALIKQIHLLEGDDKADDKILNAVFSASQLLRSVPTSFLVNGVKAATQGVIDMDDISERMRSLKKEQSDLAFEEYKQWDIEFNKIKNLLSEFIKRVLRDRKKLIVFIDDLDRCLPENTVKLLEAIKNFFYQESVIFVIAIDQGVVSEMVEKKYGLHRGYGGEYLDKIINLQIVLPRSSGISLLIDDVFVSHGFSISEGAKKSIISFCGNFLSQPRKMKKILRQALMRCLMYPSPDFSWNDDAKIQYAIFAEFLISKYPNIFLKSTAELERLFKDYSKSKGSSSDPSGASSAKASIDAKFHGGFSEIDALFRFGFFDKTQSSSAPFDYREFISVMTNLQYIQ